MAVASRRTMHVVIAATALPLFLGALLADWAYASSFQVQWKNFSAWLIAGALPLAGIASLWAVVDVLRSHLVRHRRTMIYLMLLLLTFAVGFVNALVHAKDGWAAMPAGMILSAAVLLLAVAAVAAGAGAQRRTV